MNNKSNQRAQKTEIALQDAFIKILRKKDIDAVTVTEITEVADVHRGTFYLHYRDVYDLFHSIEEQYLHEYKNDARKYLGKSEINIFSFFKNLYEFFYANKEVTKTIISTSQSTFVDKIIELRYPKKYTDWSANYRSGNQDNYLYLYCSISATFKSLIEYWCKNNFDKNPEELADIMRDILGFYGYKHV